MRNNRFSILCRILAVALLATAAIHARSSAEEALPLPEAAAPATEQPRLLDLPSLGSPEKTVSPATPPPAPAAVPAAPEPSAATPPVQPTSEKQAESPATTPQLQVTPLPATPPAPVAAGSTLAPPSAPPAAAAPTGESKPPTPATPQPPAPPQTPDQKVTVPLPSLPEKGQEVYMPLIMNLQPGNLQLLQEPVRISPAFSLMFSTNDMNTVVIPSLSLYDKSYDPNAVAQGGTDGKDDLTGLLESLKAQNDEKNLIRPLPNLYLGSIVYYSDDNWSVWINGKKIVKRRNSESNVIFVTHIDRSQVTLLWKPPTMRDVQDAWAQKISENTMPEDIVIDDGKGTITVTLRPNQTFIPRALAIVEGMAK